MYLTDICGPAHVDEEISSVYYACDEHVLAYRGNLILNWMQALIHARTDFLH